MTTYANVGHILLKRGNTTQSAAYTGPVGEVTYDTDLKTLRVHDGSTAGGNIILINQNNVSSLSSTGNLRLTTNTAGVSQQWTFGVDGNLSLPTAGYLQVSGGIVAGPFAASPAPSISGFSSVSAQNVSATGNITASSISVTSVVQYANLTTAQITAISPTSRGMTVFNYTTGNIQVYNGTKWANITLS